MFGGVILRYWPGALDDRARKMAAEAENALPTLGNLERAPMEADSADFYGGDTNARNSNDLHSDRASRE